MKKIVLIGDFDDDAESLKSCLHTLFPECEIEIVKKHSKGILIPHEYSGNNSVDWLAIRGQ